MKAHSFTKSRGRPRNEAPELNIAALSNQFRALGADPHIDRKTGTVTAFGWRINEHGRREEVALTEPQLAEYPMGILAAHGLVTQMQIIACGMHTWAHAIAFGKRSTVMRGFGGAEVADSIGESDGEKLGRLSELSVAASADETCRAAIHKAFMAAERLLMNRGPHIHGVINSAVIYEVRPSWWLDTAAPEKSQGYRWTKSGLSVLEKHWPAAVNRMHSLFCA